jgi:hypothetical protein
LGPEQQPQFGSLWTLIKVSVATAGRANYRASDQGGTIVMPPKASQPERE